MSTKRESGVFLQENPLKACSKVFEKEQPPSTVVKVSFAVEVLEFDEVAATFKASGYVNFQVNVQGCSDSDSIPLVEAKKICPFPPSDRLFTNALTTEESDSSFQVKGGVLIGSIGYTSVVGVILGYRRFPFDRQILSLVLQNENAERFPNISFEPIVDKPSWFGLLARIPDKWSSFLPILGYSTSEAYDNKTHCQFDMPIERKSSFYLVNVVFPLMVVTGLGLTAFSIELDDLSSRLSVILTLLLSAVAFKYVINQYIPNISYITVLDAYIMLSYGLFFVAAFESAMMRSPLVDVAETDMTLQIDYIVYVAYIILWLSTSLLFLGANIFGLLTESWEKVNRRKHESTLMQLNSYKYSEPTAIKNLGDQPQLKTWEMLSILVALLPWAERSMSRN